MFDAGSIIGRLVLDTSSFQTSAVGASRKVEQLGQSIVSTTRELSRAASTMSFLGAGITAPIVLAFKSAEKYSNSTREELQKMNNAIIGLRVSIAESLLPIMHRFGNVIADLAQRWESLSPALRENMLRTALLTGAFLTLGGVISSVILKIGALIGYLIKLAGTFMALATINPELLLIRLAIAAIVVAMFKWGEVGDIVMNTISLLCDVAWAGLNSVLYVTNSIVAATLALIPGLGNVKQKYIELADQALKRVANAGNSAWTTLTTGQSKFSRGFDNLKTQTQAWMDLFKNLGSQEISVNNWQEASKTFAQGWRDTWDKTLSDLQNFGAMAENAIQGMAAGMRSSFSNLFQGLFKGNVSSFEEFMTSIGDLFLKTISDMIAQLAVLWMWQQLTGIISGGVVTGGVGGVVSSTAQFGRVWSPSFAEGTDSIPYTGNYKLHEGEKVTPKYDATKDEAMDITIVNQITPEAVATAMSGKEGQGVIVNTIDTNALRSGITRRAIRRK